MSSKPLEEAIRSLPASWFRPNRVVYWSDLLASAAIGWVAFGLAVEADGWARGASLMVAGFALYRAVLFIHEITHLAGRDVPGFRVVWNAAVGVPLLLPSFLYEGVHHDHHRQRCYGTVRDPEYVPFGRQSPGTIALFMISSALLPIGLVLRFAVAAPLSWLLPRWRRVVARRASSLVINTAYVRRVPIDRAGRAGEAAACAFVWLAGVLWARGVLPGRAIAFWFAFSALASAVNAVRTLGAHRYDHGDGELTMIEQLLDSCTIAGASSIGARVAAMGRAAMAPVGLRYHALHHWIPSLPYHNLGRAHRRLVATLSGDAPYRQAMYPGFAPVIAGLVRRAHVQGR